MILEGLQLDRYHLLERIGGGAGGQVYRAKDTYMSLDREVAVKVITLPDDANDVKLIMTLFLREVHAISQLNHPHILPLFDYGIEPRTKLAYIVMPLCQRGSLASWRKKRILAPQVVMHFLHQASHALQQAHDHQIVHKDVKPQNFLIRDNIDNPKLPDLMLTDFGVVKLNTAPFSLGNLLGGTPNYMAPEQWNRKPVYASDQYSLAVMAYELLVGHLPFQGSSADELEEQHHTAMPIPPSTQNPNISINIDKVILHALAKNPESRFSSVTTFYEAFQLAVQSSERGADIHMILSISETEAQFGTECPLALPDGQQITITVPANAQNGQIISLEGQGEPSPHGGLAGTLIITIVTKPDFSSEQMIIKQLQGLTERLDSLKADISKKDQATSDNLAKLSQSLNVMGLKVSADRARSKRPRGLAILIAVLIIIVGSSASLLYSKNQVAVANDIIAHTNIVIAHNATAIAHANATAIAIATNPYPSYLPGNGNLALYDPLVDHSNSASWDGSCQILNKAFHISQSSHGTSKGFIDSCYAEATNFSNFAFEVEMTMIKGDCGGVVFRSAPLGTVFYYFEVCSSGFESLWLIREGAATAIIDRSFSSTIRTGLGQSNLLTVVASGSNITTYINQYQIGKITDNYSSHGQIGLSATDYTNPTEVAFRNVKVWLLE